FANTMTGLGGADTMIGGGGNDSYSYYGTETIIERIGGGIDTVMSDVSFILPNQVENLFLSDYGRAINGTGNGLANVLTGNGSANWLNGGAGADTLLGGAGNDTYVTDGLDTIIEDSSRAGTDTVRSTASYALGFSLENLVLLGTADLSGTGNGGTNRLIGNTGANWLYGGRGNDSIWGGGGDDRLIGGAGADRLSGGGGNDTYVTDGLDTIIEDSLSAGTDTVSSTASYTLGFALENLTLLGTGNLSGTGNGAANRLIGTTGANWLNGGGGNDSIWGGGGDDRLIGGAGADRLTGGAGTDRFLFASTSGADTV
ncbi:calcium-binding protein, partial [bacterium]|nr:calcium-binding protein [bacterium]